MACMIRRLGSLAGGGKPGLVSSRNKRRSCIWGWERWDCCGMTAWTGVREGEQTWAARSIATLLRLTCLDFWPNWAQLLFPGGLRVVSGRIGWKSDTPGHPDCSPFYPRISPNDRHFHGSNVPSRIGGNLLTALGNQVPPTPLLLHGRSLGPEQGCPVRYRRVAANSRVRSGEIGGRALDS